MPPATRKRIAEVGFISLIVLGLLVLGTMLVQQLIMQQPPAARWQVPFGGVLVLLGLHSTYFRSELADIARSTNRSVWSRLFLQALPGNTVRGCFCLVALD